LRRLCIVANPGCRVCGSNLSYRGKKGKKKWVVKNLSEINVYFSANFEIYGGGLVILRQNSLSYRGKGSNVINPQIF